MRSRSARSAIAWERSGEAKAISGYVFRIAPFEPLVAAAVDLSRLQLDGSVKAIGRVPPTNSSGFAFDSVPPGRYVLRVRRIGYAPVSDTIEVTAGSSVSVRAILATDTFVFDECGLTYIEKRVPWWIRK